MKTPLIATLILVVTSTGAALAAEKCDVPVAEWQPREALQTKLEADGWQVRSIKTEVGVPGGAQTPLVMVNASPAVEARVAAYGDTLKFLARISEISYAPAAPKGSVQIIARGAVAALALEGVIDIEAEKARLKKEMDKIDGEIAKINAKLDNPDFISRAKEEVIEENRERLEEALARRAKLQDALAGL